MNDYFNSKDKEFYQQDIDVMEKCIYRDAFDAALTELAKAPKDAREFDVLVDQHGTPFEVQNHGASFLSCTTVLSAN